MYDYSLQHVLSAHKFTGKERDSESGLDNFGARYNSSAIGRFMSPDNPKFSEKADPQTWNLYSYVSNNPLARVDLTGNNWFNEGGTWKWYDGANVTKDGKACRQGTKDAIIATSPTYWSSGHGQQRRIIVLYICQASGEENDSYATFAYMVMSGKFDAAFASLGLEPPDRHVYFPSPSIN